MKMIHYEVIQETNVGTQENPVIKKERRRLTEVPLSDISFPEIYKKCLAEACDGEITIEEF